MKKLKDHPLIFILILLGFLFELSPVLLCIVLLCYFLCIPQFGYNQKKFSYETQRFNDANLYMSQMSQSFIYTRDVIQSLKETEWCFPNGRMRDTITHALQMMEDGKWDIKRAEREALDYIEECYACEKVRTLHRFFLNVEELGGECRKEFQILETARIAWQSVIEKIRMRRYWERNIGALIYGFFITICIIMLQIMRDSELDIMHMIVTQLVDLCMLLGFVFYVLFMDNRLNKSLLIDADVMPEEKANRYFAYLESYDPKVERQKYRAFTLLSVMLTAVLCYFKPTGFTLAIGGSLVFLSLHMHSIIHLDVVHSLRREIEQAFPKWLFDIMLLLQRESVEGAIEKSYDTAPPILKRDLARMIELFSIKPHDPDAYMSFLGDFNFQGVNEIMHKLYSLAVGANRDAAVLDVVMEKNIKNLERAERDSLMFKDSVKSFTWIPFICAGFGCIGYLVIAIMTSVNGIIELLR